MNPGVRRLLRPSWLISHVLVAALIVSTLCLGIWQLRRLDERQSYNDLFESRSSQPTESLMVLLEGAEDITNIFYRSAEVYGEFDSSRQVYVVNKAQDGVAGVHAVSALKVQGEDTYVAVNRGFVPRVLYLEEGQKNLLPPSGIINIKGLVIEDKEDTRGYGDEVAEIDLETLSSYWKVPLAPVVLQEQFENDTKQILIPLPAPDLSEGPHLSYAVQWFIFMTIGLIGYPIVLRKIARQTIQVA